MNTSASSLDRTLISDIATTPQADSPPDLTIYADLLSEKFGFPGLRPGQSEALAALDTSDVLAVLPTGSGKSMAYVLPALVSSRVLVVSPHIALMQDQVESLVANGIRAAFINSNLTNVQKRNTYIDFRDGNLDLLYTSPESLANQRFVDGLARVGINLLAIDEAHCVSEWGHTFRPDYLRLDAVRKQLGTPRTVALTATATAQARDDIARRLGLSEAVRVVHSVDRPNLTFSVEYAGGNRAKQDFLVEYTTDRRGKSGIVYTGSRKRTEELAELLSGAGLRAAHYHAGMPPRERSETQRRFMTDQIDVMVATNAFGLGVDKPDVRYIVHYDMPGRLEAYYQESGRAGRDGEPSECVLIYTSWSAQSPRRFIEADHPPMSELRTAWRRLCTSVGPGGMIPESGLGNFDGAVMALRAFQESELVDSSATRALSDNPDARISSVTVDRHREHEFEMLERMLGYAQTLGCRRSYILHYFGEKPVESCGSCDNCQNAVGADGSGLVERLIRLRAEISKRDRMDAIDVFEDRTAREIASARPRDETELLEVWGIGPVRARRWGAELLGEVQAWEAEHPDAGPRVVAGSTAPKTSSSQSRRPDHADMPLFDALREWRKSRAQEEGVPAFVVFSDRTLASMAQVKPTNMEELFTVFGVGAAKRDRFGTAVLELIAEFEDGAVNG
ncbi:MAG: ATP-dependent DNA helicase RecQ [Chloroflexi bacterium]|nr:ATP-dependent DNA helicase RecQ [Chloroflexota bacterium]MBT6683107.1 ATP-dependent DNA helicase RecQ [Chloroflexota bacterium]